MKKRQPIGFVCAVGIGTILGFSCSDVETTDKPAECELGAVRSCDCPDDSESYQTCIETPTAIVFGDCACFDEDAQLDQAGDDPSEDDAEVSDMIDATGDDGEQNDVADQVIDDGAAEVTDGAEIVDDAHTSDTLAPFGTPADFAAVNNDGIVTFSWTAVDDADGYYIYWATETGVTPDNYNTLAGGTQTTAASSPDTLTGLSMGVPIYAVLTAYRGIEQSDPSPQRTVTPLRSLVVAPTFAPHGADWNDYVSATTSELCTGTETGIDGCYHGGEERIALVPGLSTCASVTATDSLGAFEWTCMVTDNVFVRSTGLRDNTNLSDLINFSTQSWRPITLTVHSSGVPYAQSDPGDPWWGNTIVLNNAGGTLNVPGQIVVVTSSAEMAPFVFGTNKIALLIAPGTTLNVQNEQNAAVDTALFSYLWVEGDIDAAGNHAGLYVHGSSFSMFRNLTIMNADWVDTVARGIYINDGRNNRLHHIEVDSVIGIGVDIDSSENHELSDIRVSNNLAAGINGVGFNVTSSEGIHVSDLMLANNSFVAVGLEDTHHSTFTDVSIFNGTHHPAGLGALHLTQSTNNVFADLLIAGNDSTAVFCYSGCHNNVFLNASVMNNDGRGFHIAGLDDSNPPPSDGRNVVMNLASFNNSSDGFQIEKSDGNTIVNLATVARGSSNDYHVRLEDTSNNAFMGRLKVGGMVDAESRFCRVDPEIGSPGLHDTTCTMTGAQDSSSYGPGISTVSNAILSIDLDLNWLLVGRWAEDDPSNSSDDMGTALYDTALDWFTFNRPYRAWATNSGTGLTTSASQGPCEVSEACRIWDFNYFDDDTGDNTYPVVYEVLSQPYGDDTVTHEWFTDGTRLCEDSPAGAALDPCETTFLINAVELMDDSVGNDNGLCESDEDCLYTPNIGVYQGHGVVIGLSDIDTGTITGVDLFRHTNNGFTRP